MQQAKELESNTLSCVFLVSSAIRKQAQGSERAQYKVAMVLRRQDGKSGDKDTVQISPGWIKAFFTRTAFVSFRFLNPTWQLHMRLEHQLVTQTAEPSHQSDRLQPHAYFSYSLSGMYGTHMIFLGSMTSPGEPAAFK